MTKAVAREREQVRMVCPGCPCVVPLSFQRPEGQSGHWRGPVSCYSWRGLWETHPGPLPAELLLCLSHPEQHPTPQQGQGTGGPGSWVHFL